MLIRQVILRFFAMVKPWTKGDKPDDITLVALVPMKDYQKFVSANPNCSEPDANGIAALTSNLFITEYAQYGLVCENMQYQQAIQLFTAIADSDKSLAGQLDAVTLAESNNEKFWVYANIERCAKAYFEFIIEQNENMQRRAAQHSPQVSDPNANIELLKGMLGIIEDEVGIYSRCGQTRR